MKAFYKIFLLFTFLLTLSAFFSVSTLADDSTSNAIDDIGINTRVTTITNASEIQRFIDENHIVDVPDIINSLTIIRYTPNESQIEQESSQICSWGDSSYYLKNVSSQRVSNYIIGTRISPPSGVIRVKQTIECSISVGANVDAVFVGASLGVDLTSGLEIEIEQQVVVPAGESYVLAQVYVESWEYSFEVWKEGLFADTYVGSGSASKPIEYYVLLFNASDIGYV